MELGEMATSPKDVFPSGPPEQLGELRHDNQMTARAIAIECGIIDEADSAYTGNEFEFRMLNDTALESMIPRLQVLGRASQEDKAALVQKLKQLGNTIDMPDAIGEPNSGKTMSTFPMGPAGLEVAKEASSVVLHDDNFGSIITALEWGRAVQKCTPAGSSTGSAVGVACGFAPISLGSETSGSLVSPSSNASLYALKLTPGSNSLQGILALTSHFETIGAIGKSALDVALACDALANMDEVPTLASAALSSKPDDLSVGFVDIEQWRLPEGVQNQDPEYYKQTAREYLAAKELLKDYGTKVSDVYITHPEKYLVGDFNANDLMSDIIGKFERALHKFHLLIKCISAQEGKAGIERYLEHLEYSKARTLDAVVEFHMDHPQLEFDKDRLINLINKANPKERLMERLDACKQWAATDGIDKVVQEHGVDVVVCCSDSFFAGVSVAARYPMAAMPLGYIASSGRPYGLLAIAKANEEAKLVKLMAIWNAISSPRRVPNLESCAKARPYL
ncbi:Calcium-transporting ATPase [Paramyrothecium foliicola]|nr:Calcium-transporting ATPase [Paramyrothecium foliicola]